MTARNAGAVVRRARRLQTEAEAQNVAVDVQRGGRTKPILVVSIANGQLDPYVDVEELEQALVGLCDIYVLVTGDPSWAFSRGLPDGCQVYGGASRVYPIDLGWLHDLSRSPLRFAFGRRDKKRVTEQLIDDALTAVYDGRQESPAPPAAGKQSAGVVTGVVGGRALVQLDQGGTWPAVVWPELVSPGVAAERMFVKGQRLSGLHEAGSNRLDLAGSRQTAEEAFRDVRVGDELLVQILSVEPQRVTATLLPGVEITIDAAEFGAEPDDDVRELVTPLEVMAVEVVDVGDGTPSDVRPLFSQRADGAKPVSLFAGGPAWLIADQLGPPAMEDPTDGNKNDVSHTEGRSVETAEMAESTAMLQRIADLEREVKRLDNELAQSRTSARAARQQAKEAAKDGAALRSDRVRASSNLFADRFDQFRYEVYVAWAERTTAHDKQDYPWRAFEVGPAFFETWDKVEGIDPVKIVEATADVVCGRVHAMDARDLHQLRAGKGAGDPPVTRAAGGTCWRLSLQTKVAAARRLHFWRLQDGTVELSSVRLHDDIQP